MSVKSRMILLIALTHFAGLCLTDHVLYAQSLQSAQFSDAAVEAGVNSGARSRGVAFGDFNNDGYVDIYVCRYQANNILFNNLGNSTFSDVTNEAGLAGIEDSGMAVWSDFDNDGNRDLYIVRFESDYLFRNNGDGSFTELSNSAGIIHNRKGVAAAVADVDNDGFLDIYVANFSDQNILYHNNGDWTFTDRTTESKALDTGYAMGIAFCDYDNDGDQDLLLAHDGSQGNLLYQNDGTGVFRDAASEAHMKYAPLAMGVGFGDYNNDGHFDLYITTLGPNLLYRSDGIGWFTLMPFLPKHADDGGMGW
ncbi:MAG: VCBS repeat-containing protein, partial [bacterium]